MDSDVIDRGFDQQIKALAGGYVKNHPGEKGVGLAVLGIRRPSQCPAVHSNYFRVQAGDGEPIQ